MKPTYLAAATAVRLETNIIKPRINKNNIKNYMALSNHVPTIDLDPFFRDGDEKGMKKAMEEITQASSEYGFFQVVNHGVPLNLINRAMEILKDFFDCPSDQKLKSSPKADVIPPAGYFKTPLHSIERHEHFLITSPSLGKNVYPDSHPQLREVLDEIFPRFTKLAILLERIISIWLGLKPEFLKEYNNDRSCDFFLGLHYPPATGSESNGKSAHEDGNCLSFIVQDDVEGLQVLNNGQWILVPPAYGALVVNIGDVLQVLTNKKLKSPTHRVINSREKNRYSCAFFYTLSGDKWVEPLSQFTDEIGESPKYRGFIYKEYMDLRFKNRTKPPSRPEDLIHISHYELDPPHHNM